MSIDSNAAVTRLRRLTEPRNFNSHHSDRKATLKQRPTDTQRSKISPVSKINRITSAAASNQRISARSSPGSVRDKEKAKEIASGASEGQASLSFSIGQKKINERSLRLGQMAQTNDTLVIDKKVLTIEHEMPVVPPVQASEKSKELRSRSLDGDTAEEKAEVVPKYEAIRVPPSNMVIDGIATTGETKQVATDSVVEVTSNFSRVTLNEQPYRAPHARKPSLEDLCVVSSGSGKVLPTISETPIPVGSFKANVPESSSSSPSKQILDGSERSPRKESKGLKHLLKFGRKNSGSPSSEKETDQQKVDGVVPDAAANADSGYEANSLKNLISQDDSYSEGSTMHKAPRSLSLLSPFRSNKQG